MKGLDSYELVTCRHCGRAMKSVSAPHLVRRHAYDPRHPVEEYKRAFHLECSKSQDTRDRTRAAYIRTLESAGRRWSRARVLRQIRSLQRKGKRLNWVSASKSGSLTAMGKILFGSWGNAVAAAGIDYSKVRMVRAWTKERALSALRREYDLGRDVSHRALAKRDPGLRRTIRRIFGSWDAGLEAAGIDPARVRKLRVWTRDRLLAILRRERPRFCSELARKDAGAAAIVYTFFRSWHEALRVAGLPSPTSRKEWWWSRTRVLEEIRARAGDGRGIRPSIVRRSAHGLHAAASREFGSWDGAVKAAGCIRALRAEVSK